MKDFLTTEFSFSKEALGKPGHTYSHDINKGTAGFAKRQIIPRVFAVALPIFTLLDVIYNTVALTIKFTANVLTGTYLGHKYKSFGLSKMGLHAKKIGIFAVETLFSAPVGLFSPKTVFAQYEKSEYSEFKDRLEEDPFFLLEKRLLAVEGENMATLPSYDAIQASIRGHNRQELQDKLDLRMAGHILGDAFIESTGLEGNAGSTSLEYASILMQDIQNRSQKGENSLRPQSLDKKKVDAITEALSHCHAHSEKIDAVAESGSQDEFKDLVEETHKNIHDLAVGKSFLMRMGWAGSPGHGMLLEIKKKRYRGIGVRYTVHVYNTGAGTETQKHIRKGNQIKFVPVIKYDNVNRDELNPFFFEQVLEAMIKPHWDPTAEEYQYNQKNIYHQILGPLASKKVNLSSKESFTTIGQRSGTCSFRCILALMRHKFGNDTHYKALKLEMSLTTLMDMAVKIKNGAYEHPEVAKTILERSLQNMARFLLKQWDPTNPKGISPDTVKRAYAILKHIKKEIPAPRAVVTKSNKDLSHLKETEFPSQFKEIGWLIPFLGESREVKGENDEFARPFPVSTNPFERPQNFASTIALFEQSHKLSTDLLEDNEKKKAGTVAADTLLKLPPLTDEAFWNSISSVDDIKTVMNHIRDITRTLVAKRMTKEDGHKRSRDFLAVTKAFFLMAHLAKKFDPSLAQYGLDTSYLEEVEKRKGFITATPELNEEYEAIKAYVSSSLASGSSNLKRLFSYQDPKEDPKKPLSRSKYFISKESLETDGELEYLNNKARKIISPEKIQGYRDQLLIPTHADLQMANIATLFIHAKEFDELYAYTQLRDSYALMHSVLRGTKSIDHLDMSALYNIKLNDADSKKVGVGFSFNETSYGGGSLWSFGTDEENSFTPFSQAESNENVEKLFDRQRFKPGAIYWDTNGLKSSHGEEITFENEIPIQANEAGSERDVAKDIYSSLHNENLIVPSLMQLFQRGDYIDKLGEHAYQDAVFEKFFHAGRLMSALDREPLLAQQLLKFTQIGRNHFSKSLGRRLQLQPSLFFMNLALRLLPFIEKQQEKQGLIAQRVGSQSPLEGIDCVALKAEYIQTLNKWLDLVKDPEEKVAIYSLIARAHLNSLTKNGPLPQVGTPEYKHLQEELIELQKAYAFLNYNGMRNAFRNPLFEEELTEEMMKASSTISQLLKDSAFKMHALNEVLSCLGIKETPLMVKEERFPKIKCAGGDPRKEYCINFLTGTVTKKGGQVRSAPPLSFRDHEMYQRFFGKRVLGPGTLTNGMNYEVIDEESGLGEIRIQLRGDTFTLFRKIDGEWYENFPDTNFIVKELKKFPTLLLHTELNSSITGKNKHLYTHWKSCSSDDDNRGTLIIADKTGQRLLYKISHTKPEDDSLLPYDSIQKYTTDNTLSDDRVINVNSQDETIQNILAPFSHFANIKHAAIAIKGEGESGIKELNFPLYYDEEGRPLSFIKRDDGRLAMTISPEFAIAEDQTVEALGKGFHNYLLVEDRQGHKKLLVPSMAFKKTEQPFSLSAKLDLSGMKECPYHLFNIDSLGKVQATTTEGLAFLAYFSLAKRDYKTAREYLQRANSFDRYTPETLKIFMDLCSLPKINKDQTADAKSLRLYASYLVIKNFQETPGKELEEGDLKEFWCGDASYERIRKNYSSHLKHKNNCSRDNRFELLVDSPDNEFSFLNQLVKNCEGVDPTLLMRINHFDPKERTHTKQEVHFHLVEDLQAIGEKIKHFDQLVTSECMKTEEFRQINPLGQLSEILENHLDTEAAEGHVSSLMKPNVDSFFKNLKTYYERATSSDSKVRKKLRQELLAIGEFTHTPQEDADDESPDDRLEASKTTSLQANFLRYFLLFLSNKCGSKGYKNLPTFPTNTHEIGAFVNNLGNYVPIFQLSLIWKRVKLSIHKTAKVALVVLKNFPSFVKTVWKHGRNWEEIRKSVFESAVGLPGCLNTAKHVQAVAMRRITSRMGASWKQTPEKVERSIKITHENVLDFEKRPLSTYSQTYFEKTKGQTSEKPSLIDVSALPDTTPEFTLRRIKTLNEDYQLGCRQNAEKECFAFRDGVNITHLNTRLLHSIEEDSTHLKLLEEQILDLANKRDEIWQRQARRELQIDSRQSNRLDLETCENLFALNDYQPFIDKNPFLSVSDVTALTQKIAEYSLIKIRYQQTQRANGYLKHYLNIREQIKAGGLTQEKLTKLTVQSRDLEQRIGETLNAERVYDLTKWRELLIFESRSNKMLWSEQFKLLEKMFPTDENQDNRDIILQLIMGGGKTDVINNIQAYKKANGDHLSVLVVLPSLFNTNKNDIARKAKNCFGQDSIAIRYDRTKECFTLDYIDRLYRRIVEAREKKKLVIVTPATLHFLKHGYLEACDQLDKILTTVSSAKVSELVLKKELLRKTLELFSVKGNFTYDEPHKLFDASREYNSPMGIGEALNSDCIGMISHVMHRIANDYKNLVNIRQGKQYLMTEENYQALRQQLVIDLSQYAPLNLSQDLHQGFRAYALGHTNAQAKAFKKEIEKWADSQDVEKQRAADLIALSKRLLNGLLKDCFKKRPGIAYGLSQDPKRNVGIEISIPYSGNNRPQEESRIADPLEMMIKTLCKYYDTSEKNAAIRGLSLTQTRQWLQEKQAEAREEMENHVGILANDTKASRAVHRITGTNLLDIDLFSDKALEPIRHQLNDPDNKYATEAINEYLEAYVFSKEKQYPEQINTTGIDLGDMPRSGHGYSGTLENYQTFHKRYLINKNEGTNGRTIDHLVKENDDVRMITKTGPKELLEELLPNEDALDYHAFIDAGAHFTGYRNLAIAKEFLEFFESKPNSTIKGVMFFDGDRLSLLKRGAKKPIYLNSSEPLAIKQQTNLDPDEYFGYFDDVHTTGANLPLFWKTKAFATIGNNTTKTKKLQGDKRLRGLHKQQRVTTLVPKAIESNLRRAIGKEEDPIDIKDVLIFTEINESKEQLEDNLRSCLQKMRYEVRDYIFKRVLHTHNNDDISMMHYYRKLFIDDVETSAWKLFSELNREISTDEFLEKMKMKYMVLAQKFFNKSERAEIKERLNAAIQEFDGSLPTTVKSPINQTNKTMEQQVQQEVERQEEREEEQERSTSGLRELIVLQTAKWQVNDVYSDPCFKPIAEKRISQGLKRKKRLDTNQPILFRLKEVMARSRPLKGYAEAFDENILVTENLIKVLLEKPAALSGYLAKGLYQILAIRENGRWKFLFLSVEDAAYFQNVLAKERGQKSGGERQMWLLAPNGTLIQQGRDLLTNKLRNEEGFKQGLVQALAYKGDYEGLVKQQQDVCKWANRSHSKLKNAFVKMRIPRQFLTRFERSPLRAALNPVSAAA